MCTNKTPIKLYLRCQMYNIILHDKPPESNLDIVRKDVERLAERSGIMGSSWCLEHSANWIQFLRYGGGGSSAAPV